MKKIFIKIVSCSLSFLAGVSLASLRFAPQHAVTSRNCEVRPVAEVLSADLSSLPAAKQMDSLASAFPPEQSERYSGSLLWSGVVNGTGNIVLRKGAASYQPINGPGVNDFRYLLSAALPTMPARIWIRMNVGKARMIQSPGPTNGYVTVVQVEGHQQPVSFTLYWSVL
ncbi:MAG TPA: hypothetical protein VFC63_17685 [Blastocatellia bacterium]|nr:hypothetical protein [Blastocatellia bacterium]